MEKLMEILEEIRPEADFENCKTLIDDGVLDSFDVMSIISELGDEFEIEIKPADVIPANFNSAEAMWEMVKRLQNK
ncbi:phosphopantetheine-binding protein [Hominifimenecus sp. rT4P-3]|uniref:phosphopantetheine-binding protein n=1 Tax=Hominifimenecus sp. rT4P-3 TaxID=3242979 RepID=UPI003DA562CC